MLGRITYWNSYRRYGFITVTVSDGNGLFQEQYFFHHSNFRNGDAPALGALVVFNLGEPVALGKKVQAVHVRYATSMDVTGLDTSGSIEAPSRAVSDQKVEGTSQNEGGAE